MLSLIVFACPTGAQSDTDELEFAVKAAYLCKIPAFVTWPAAALPKDRFVLCVVGRPILGQLLDRAADGETVQQRPIVIRRYASITSNPGCQLVFATGSDVQSVAAVQAIFRGTPVLTVTDEQIDPDSTGMINFVLTNARVRFEIDRRSAEDNGLVISSKLLGLAVRVRNRPSP